MVSQNSLQPPGPFRKHWNVLLQTVEKLEELNADIRTIYFSLKETAIYTNSKPDQIKGEFVRDGSTGQHLIYKAQLNGVLIIWSETGGAQCRA